MVGPLQAGVLVCVMTDLRSCFNRTKAPPSELPYDNGVDEVKVPFRKVTVHEAAWDLIRLDRYERQNSRLKNALRRLTTIKLSTC
jgi:hypothetical protein